MRKKALHFSEADRLSILRDYYSSGMSLSACARKHNFRFRFPFLAENLRYTTLKGFTAFHNGRNYSVANVGNNVRRF